MPFTLAHPAAVLPLRRTGLPMVALVAGSMVPDVPLFTARLAHSRLVAYDVTHSWLGVVTLDPLMALVATALWYAVARDALVDLAPAVVRHRLPAHTRLTGRQWLLVPVAAVVGAVTHVCWDAFTHRGRWGTSLVPALDHVYAGRHGYAWAQYASGVFGLTVLTVATVRYLRRQPVVPRSRRAAGRVGGLVPAVAGAVVLVSSVLALTAAGSAHGDRIHVVQVAMETGLLACGIGIGLVCLLWRAVAQPA